MIVIQFGPEDVTTQSYEEIKLVLDKYYIKTNCIMVVKEWNFLKGLEKKKGRNYSIPYFEWVKRKKKIANSENH